MAATALLQIALKQFGADAPTTHSILRVSVVLAEAVNKNKDLSGHAKMDLVVQTLRDVLVMPEVATRIPEEARGPLKVVVDTVVPEALSLIIEAGRGQYDLKKPSVGCLAKLCGLTCRRAGARVGGGVGAALTAVAAKVEEVGDVAPPVVAVVIAEEKPAPAPVPVDATVPAAAGVSPPPVPFEPRPEVPTPAVEKK
jgi:hypothetical protein